MLYLRFQSTPPVWAETSPEISSYLIPLDFNPLRPCGRRLFVPSSSHACAEFQSTPPVWAETLRCKINVGSIFTFQSTPPVWAETVEFVEFFQNRSRFQSTPPVWAETPSLPFCAVSFPQISIHSARVGGDIRARFARGREIVFQSTPPVWAETAQMRRGTASAIISIHSARVGGDDIKGGS